MYNCQMKMNSQDEVSDFIPSDLVRRLIQSWWLVTVIVIVGGIGGLIVSRLQKPLYESTAIITTAIDFAYAGRLTDYEEDHLINAIGDLINSSEVMDELTHQVRSAGFLDDPKQLEKSISLSRQGYRWELSSRFNDPAKAQKVNQIWVDASVTALERMRNNSINGLRKYLLQQSMETCFTQSVIVDPASDYCSSEELKSLQSNIQETTSDENKEDLLSSLLISSVSFQVTQKPSLPLTPVQKQANLSTFAGAMIGLLISISMFLLGFPKSMSTG